MGQLSAGVLLDRIDTPKIAAPFFAAALAGAIILHTAAYAPTLYMGSVLLGLGQGSELTIAAYFRAADLEGFLSNLAQNNPSLEIRREGDMVHIASSR